jgi:hypothetical protein
MQVIARFPGRCSLDVRPAQAHRTMTRGSDLPLRPICERRALFFFVARAWKGRCQRKRAATVAGEYASVRAQVASSGTKCTDVRVVPPAPVPSSFETTAGCLQDSILHNLRAAIEYLVWPRSRLAKLTRPARRAPWSRPLRDRCLPGIASRHLKLLARCPLRVKSRDWLATEDCPLWAKSRRCAVTRARAAANPLSKRHLS